MRAVIAELARRLSVAEAAARAVTGEAVPAGGAVGGGPRMSRAERRATERDRRRHRH